jgi:hypothetical protein
MTNRETTNAVDDAVYFTVIRAVYRAVDLDVNLAAGRAWYGVVDRNVGDSVDRAVDRAVYRDVNRAFSGLTANDAVEGDANAVSRELQKGGTRHDQP